MAPHSSKDSNNYVSKNEGLASLFKSMGGGDDCDRPACDDTKSALTAALERAGRSNTDASESTSKQIRKKLPKSVKDQSVPKGYIACPPTRDEIGVSTWSLLHSMAAWYPSQPTSEDKKLMSNFMIALARFYPCTWCATDFQNNVQLSPPRTETREDLCLWLCEQHNIVNDKLGKPLFHCSMGNLDERWRKSSDPDCQK
mmetsp:Transcript_7483/g.11165  ORF Transcript_7483/g.11165 Transcript_7483/m.11165 type:complete len:199 (-) Transcript_7483:1493-2089(-)